MTANDLLGPLAHIVADLSREVPPGDRLQRLLDMLVTTFPCDAAALLEIEESELVPRAMCGLSSEIWGRRFAISEQPRLEAILCSPDPIHFPAGSPLADPYDGMVETIHEQGCVHGCIGAPLHVNGHLWGVLTLDALQPDAFADVDLALFRTFASLAAASIRTAEHLHIREATEYDHKQPAPVSQSGNETEAELLGNSNAIQRLRQEVQLVGRLGLSVLVQGETGVGKELVARLVHRHSPRADRTMVQVNCAALPETLAESELFGHVSGAFSGANRDRAGKFELADGGTLFLDEVGELPLTIQAKLLRALQSGEIQRVGSDRTHRVDVRIVAATNRDLSAEVEAGRFRADLYHRLNVYPVTVPPLRERDEDLFLLAGHFLQRCERRFGLRGVRFGHAARSWLGASRWPGNVRELENTIIRAVVRALSEGHPKDRIIELGRRHFDADPIALIPMAQAIQVPGTVQQECSLAEAVEQFKRELIKNRLQHYPDNLSAAARSLGLDRANFYRQLRRMGLR